MNKEIHQSMLLNKKSEKKLLHSTFRIGWLKPSFNCWTITYNKSSDTSDGWIPVKTTPHKLAGI